MKLRLAALVVISALALLPCHAQLIARVPNSNGAAQPTSTISGIVVNAVTGEPLKRARVTVVPMGGGSDDPFEGETATDQDGHFELTGATPGKYLIVAQKEGFAGAGNRGFEFSHGTRVEVTAGTDLTGVRVKLSPGAVITGRITDADGDPISNVAVSAIRYIYSPAKRADVWAQAQTDDLGEYRLYGLDPGHYFIAAKADLQWKKRIAAARPGSSRPADAEQSVAYPVTYYPGVLDLSKAVTVEARAGEEGRADLSLTSVPTVHVRGTIAGARPGEVINIALIHPFPALETNGLGDGSAQQTVAASNGVFDFGGVLPGRYTLMAFAIHDAEGDSSPLRVAYLSVEVDGNDLNSLQLTLSDRRSSPVRGRITSTGASADWSGLAVTLVPTGPTSSSLMTGMSEDVADASGQVNKDGTFSFPAPPDGTYRVMLTTSQPDVFADWFTKSVHIGSADVTDGLTISGGAAGGSLNILVSPKGGRVAGTVTDGDQPVPEVTVVVIPDEKHRNNYDWYHTATTDRNGSFTIRGLDPGSYTVFAFDNIDQFSYMDPDFIRPFLDMGTPLTIDEGASQQLDLKLLKVSISD